MLVKSLRNLLIPTNKCNIDEAVLTMEDAYAKKIEKEAKADDLLKSIDDYVLSELGIQLPEYCKEKEFKFNVSSLLGSRYNPEYNQPYFQKLQSAIKDVEYIRLYDIVSNETVNTTKLDFVNYVDLGSIEEKTNTIEYNLIENKEIPSRAKMKINKGDLVFSGLAGSISSIAIIDENLENMVASTGFFIIKKSDKHNNDYLLALFKTSFMQRLLVRHASGAVMPAINNSELKNIFIPMPDLALQNKIANKVKAIINEAKELKKQALEGLENAQSKVEKILLGE
ncbi:MAG: restriction endonuclease subunit S [Alphaproteobacteria bacterium]